MNQLHCPDFGGSAHSASGKRRHQQIPDVVPRSQPTFHLTDDVHDMGVALDHHQLANGHRPRDADTAEVVPTEIHQHHVFSSFLGIGEQFCLQTPILERIASSRSGSCNRPQHGADTPLVRFCFDHHLRAGSDQLPVTEIEERHVRRWIHHAQAPVEIKGRVADFRAESLADHQLKGISGGDVFPGLKNRLLEVIGGSITDCCRCFPLVGSPVERPNRG